jgi:site-specific DNA recombinase
MQVQEELIRRRIVHTSPNGKNRVFSSSHCLANIVYCGTCGEFYRRIHWYNRGKKSVVWRCISRLENTGLFCDARTVPESQIEQVLVSAINQTLCQKNDFLAVLRQNIDAVLRDEKSQPLADIDKRLADLQEELLKRTAARADYDDVADEIYRLREEKQKLQLEAAGRDEQKKRSSE